MNIKIISGGQTGADRAALDVALKFEIPCGGTCPKGRLAEDGPLSQNYPLEENNSTDYRVRTRQNIVDSHGTLITTLGPIDGGTKLTEQICLQKSKPLLCIDGTQTSIEEAGTQLAEFTQDHFITILNVAGPRGSRCPEIYPFTFGLLEFFFINKILPSKKRP